MEFIVFTLAAITTVVLGQRLGRLVRPPDRTTAPVRESTEPIDVKVPDRPFARQRQWEERLELAGNDVGVFARSVRPELIRLIDDRLRLTHDITTRSDPERAAALLGDRLIAVLGLAGAADAAGAGPPRALSPGELTGLVMELEERLWMVR